MKRILAVLAAPALLLAGCNAEAGGQDVNQADEAASGMADKDKIALVRRFYEAFNTRSGEALEGVLADDWRDVPLPPGQAPGRVGMQAMIAGLDTVFADFTVKNEEIIVSGDKVVVRSTNTGRHTGPFLGLAPTGGEIEMTSIDIHTIEDGLIVETRHVEDWLSVLTQIGAVPFQTSRSSDDQ
jgi:predicted ester cyclase/predicted small secreted protein